MASAKPIGRPVSDEVKTHLEDLQAEMEAGARKLDVLAERASEMQEAILGRHLDQAALAGALVNRVQDLKNSLRQQREQLRELRHALRDQRKQLAHHRRRDRTR